MFSVKNKVIFLVLICSLITQKTKADTKCFTTLSVHNKTSVESLEELVAEETTTHSNKNVVETNANIISFKPAVTVEPLPDVEIFLPTVPGIPEIHTNIPYPKRNPFLEWLFSLFGVEYPDNSSVAEEIIEPPKNCSTCTCGLTYHHKRIVGGVETQVNEYPWMTYLTYNGRFYCGASVINDRYLLTAAHCVNGFPRDRLGATFLDHDRSTATETKTITRKISRITRHRAYGSGNVYNNDIAIVKLDQSLPFTGILKPVCLPTVGKSFTNYTGIAVGWGTTSQHGQVSNKLMEVEVPIMSNVDCRKTAYGNRITDNMICAGYPQGGKDSCQGDSGGPLHVMNGTKHEIVGIVSWGEGCAQKNYPGVYTRVNRYLSWITSNTRDACYCQ